MMALYDFKEFLNVGLGLDKGNDLVFELTKIKRVYRCISVAFAL